MFITSSFGSNQYCAYYRATPGSSMQHTYTQSMYGVDAFSSNSRRRDASCARFLNSCKPMRASWAISLSGAQIGVNQILPIQRHCCSRNVNTNAHSCCVHTRYFRAQERVHGWNEHSLQYDGDAWQFVLFASLFSLAGWARPWGGESNGLFTEGDAPIEGEEIKQHFQATTHYECWKYWEL